MKIKKQTHLFTLIILLIMLLVVPLAVFLAQKRAKLRSGAYEYSDYNISCVEDAATGYPTVLRVYNLHEEYDVPHGQYTLSWDVENVSAETLTINAELYSCRCSEENAQSTPAELSADVNSPYYGFDYLCVGSWPEITTTNPPTVDEVNQRWNYCDYAYYADTAKLDANGNQTIINEKIARAQATNQKTGIKTDDGPIILNPGEQKAFLWTTSTTGATNTNCGSFQIIWDILEISKETEECTIRKIPGQLTSTVGALITGEGNDITSIWRYSDSTPVGGTCELSTEPLCGNGTCDPGETNANCPQDCPLVVSNGICEGMSCRECVGDECNQINNKCTSADDCRENICVANNSCSYVSIEDLRGRLSRGELVINCEQDSECNVNAVCHNNSCILKRGDLEPGDKTCNTTGNDPSTGRNEECVEYYWSCEGEQCVKKEGAEAKSTCDPEDPNACKGFCYQKTCYLPEELTVPSLAGLERCSYTDALAHNQPAVCSRDVCFENQICENKAVEQITTEVPCTNFGASVGEICEGAPVDYICNLTTQTCQQAPVTNPGPDCSGPLDDEPCQEGGPVDYICNLTTRTCQQAPVTNPGPDCSGLGDDEPCQATPPPGGYICNYDTYNCEDPTVSTITNPGPVCENLGPDPDCLPTYWACDSGGCVEKVGEEPANTQVCDWNNPQNGCLCEARKSDPLACVANPVIPPAGVNGAALVLSIVVMVAVFIGIKMIF